jgi:hypothetical protein
LLAAIPGNQILKIHAHHKVVRTAPSAAGRLMHRPGNDLHMTAADASILRRRWTAPTAGNRTWYGDRDLVDDAACVAWLPETLGRLRSRYGVYAILGNHDQRLSMSRLRCVGRLRD